MLIQNSLILLLNVIKNIELRSEIYDLFHIIQRITQIISLYFVYCIISLKAREDSPSNGETRIIFRVENIHSKQNGLAKPQNLLHKRD